MKWLGLAPVLFVCGAAYACSGSVSTPGSTDGGDDGSGGGASSGAASGGGSGSGGGSTSGASSGTSGSTSGGTTSSGAGSSSGTTSSSGTGSSGGSSGGSGSCTSTSGCPSGEICGFPMASGCSAQGQCFPAPGVTCLAYSPGCACDGTEINITCNGLPSGYETKPLAHTGACTQQVDAGGACTSDTQCGTGQKCCYPCGVAGCTNRCTAVAPGASCPLYP